MSESWGDEDEIIDTGGDWGADDETIDAVPEPTAKPVGYTMFGDKYEIEENMSPQQQATKNYMDQVVGTGEAFGTFLSAIPAEVAAGVRGIGTTIGSGLAEMVEGDVPGITPGERGAQEVAATQEAMTYVPQTEAGREQIGDIAEAVAPVGEFFQAGEEALGGAAMEATGSPAAAAAAHTVPTAAMEALGLGAFRRASKMADTTQRVQEAAERGEDITKVVEEIDEAPRTIEEITDSIMRNRTGELVEDIKPDWEILRAADEEGISIDPSHYSTDESVKKVVQALKGLPESKLEAGEILAMKKLAQRGDELIEEIDGDLDRAVFDADVRERMDSTISGFIDMEDAQFKSLRDDIPTAARVQMANAKQFMNQRLEELGGNVKLLSTVEKKLYDMLNFGKKKGKKGQPDTEGRLPTYAALDTLRQDIGDAYKGKGPHRDDAPRNLDQVYGALIRDQRRAANDAKRLDDFDAAMALTKQRKEMQKRAAALFGKQWEKSVLPMMTNAATAMTKGDVSKFQKMMDALPEEMRGRAAATMLNDLYTLGQKRKGGGIGAGFANAYEMLERNKGAKDVLFKHLPKDARRRFDNFGLLSQGIYRAQRYANKSRTAGTQDILNSLRDGTLIERITMRGVTGTANVLGWKAFGHMGAMTADRMGKAAKTLLDRTEAADELLASPALRTALDKAMEGKVQEANIMLKRSPAWRKWRQTLGEGTQQQLAAQGPIVWLTSQREQGQQQQANGQ